MKRYSSYLLFFFIWGIALHATSIFAKRQEIVSQIKYPYLWEVSLEGKSSYLFGTMHSPDERWKKLHPLLLDALQSVDAVYGELDLTNKQAMMPILMQHMMLPAGKTLEGLVGRAFYQELTEYLKKHNHQNPMLNQMHPGLLEMMLGMLEYLPKMMQGIKSLDEIVLEKASALKKIVGGIETAEEQAKVLFGRSLDDSVASLKATLKSLKTYESKGINKTQLLDQAYFAGDEEKLLQLIQKEWDESSTEQKALLKSLLLDRNQTMASRVIKLLKEKSNQRFLFAFGTAHFIGKGSVIELLKKSGYKVKRLLAPPK